MLLSEHSAALDLWPCWFSGAWANLSFRKPSYARQHVRESWVLVTRHQHKSKFQIRSEIFTECKLSWNWPCWQLGFMMIRGQIRTLNQGRGQRSDESYERHNVISQAVSSSTRQGPPSDVQYAHFLLALGYDGQKSNKNKSITNVPRTSTTRTTFGE